MSTGEHESTCSCEWCDVADIVREYNTLIDCLDAEREVGS